jgi:hypothetical protein
VKTYDVWFVPVQEGDSKADSLLFVCDLPLRAAEAVAFNLEAEGFVSQAWVEES